MVTGGATLDISQTDGVFYANDLYTLEIHNKKSTLGTAVFSHNGDLPTSEQ